MGCVRHFTLDMVSNTMQSEQPFCIGGESSHFSTEGKGMLKMSALSPHVFLVAETVEEAETVPNAKPRKPRK
jgi:hypothetical protein